MSKGSRMDQVELINRYGISTIKQPVVRLGQLAGIPVYGAADWQLLPAAIAATGIAGGMIAGPGKGFFGNVVVGLGYGAMLAGSMVVHQLGHISSGRAVGQQMDGIVLQFPVPIELYAKRGRDVSIDTHRIRAIGGPMANLAVGLFARGISKRTGGRLGKATAFIHLAHAAGSLLPLKGLDGEVLWLGKSS